MNVQMNDRIVFQAGPAMWGKIRWLAASFELQLEESKGIVSRTFVLSGQPADLEIAIDNLETWVVQIEAHKQRQKLARARLPWYKRIFA